MNTKQVSENEEAGGTEEALNPQDSVRRRISPCPGQVAASWRHCQST